MLLTLQANGGRSNGDRLETDINSRLGRLIEDYGAFIRSAIARFCPRDLGLQLDEIEQEARIRLWRALQRERTITDPASYLYRIAASAAIDAGRRVRARREIPLSVVEGEDAETPQGLAAASIEAPDSVVLRAELRSRVETVLGSLAAKRRRAVGLYLQGFTTQEIGDLLGWSEAKARNLTYRGLTDLRTRLRSAGVSATDV